MINPRNDSWRNLMTFFLCHFCGQVWFLHQPFIPASRKSLFIQTSAWVPATLVLLKTSPRVFSGIAPTHRHEKLRWPCLHALSGNHTGSWNKAGDTIHSTSIAARRFVFKTSDKPHPIHPQNPLLRGINTKCENLLGNLVMKRTLMINKFNLVRTPATERTDTEWRDADEGAQVG